MKSASLQYATVLADIATSDSAAAGIAKQFADFTALYEGSAELRNFLASPAVNREDKQGVIEKLVARLGAGKVLRNFLFVVIDNQRTHVLPEMFRTFEEVLRERQGIAEAQVVSAVELSATQKQQIARTLERLTGRKIEAQYALDPALLGGAVVRVGSVVYDGSLRHRLDEMRARLAAD